jgi:AcrR family transcriptional regulator
MAQILKEKVRSAILKAARKVFRENGFRLATMEFIAGEAGLSVGNLYRYFRSKKTLFDAVITHSLAEHLIQTLREKFAEAAGRPAGTSAEFRQRNDKLIDFLISNRDELIILCRGSEGTEYENYVKELYESLVQFAQNYRRSMEQGRTPLPPVRSDVITLVYKSLADNIAAVIYSCPDRDSIAEGIKAIIDYHFFGVSRLLLPESE